MQKILIIEDDVGIASSLKIYLENSSFEVDHIVSGEKAVEKILQGSYDLIILDINLPIKNGIEICQEVRISSPIPIIMLTARTSEFDKVRGLEIGADDYISKPFSPRELLARIHSILRRAHFIEQESKETDESILSFGDIEINIQKMIVKKGKNEISFTNNEFEILKKIFIEDGNIITRETLMKDIIGYENYAFDRTIDTHIKNIRKKLEDKDIILTVRGVGYRLNK